jgi:hypothetical protein
MSGGGLVNGTRLWERLESMAEFGKTPAGGCNRQALTDEDARGRQRATAGGRVAGWFSGGLRLVDTTAQKLLFVE